MLKHTKKVKKIYEDIQRCLYYMIPEKWDQVYLYTSIIDQPNKEKNGELYFYYIPKGIIRKKPVNVYEIPNKFNLNEKEYMELVKRLYEYIKLLKEEFQKTTIGDIWTNFTMIIKNARFKVEYNFDDLINSEFDSYERHIIWRYKYLGIGEKQLGNKKDRQILDRYIHGAKQISKNEIYEAGIYISDIRNTIGYNTEEKEENIEVDRKSMRRNQILLSNEELEKLKNNKE